MKSLMPHPLLRLSFLLFILISTQQLSAQIQPIFIQLEDDLRGELIKYYPGSKIQFTTKEYPKTWRKEKIAKIIPHESLIVFKDGGYIHIDEIYKVRKKNIAGLTIARTLITFGQGWISYGLYAAFANLITGGVEGVALTAGSVAFGGAAWGLGKLIQKLARRKYFKMGKHTRLRIMDIRWTAPDPHKA